MKLSGKLFILVASVSAAPLALTAAAVFWRSGAVQELLASKSSEVGDLSGRAGQEALYEQAQRLQLEAVQGKSQELQAFFETVRRALLAGTALAEQALAEEPSPSAPPAYTDQEVVRRAADTTDRFNDQILGKQPYLVYHAAPGLSPAAAAPLVAKLRRLAPFFALNARESPWCHSIYLGTREGLMIGYPGGDLFPPGYDPRARPWYQKVDRQGSPVYTDIYRDKNGSTLVMTAGAPVKDASGSLAAVTAIDINLTAIITRLFELGGLPVSEAALISGGGRVKMWATYRDGDRARVTPNLELEPPHVRDFHGGSFLRAFQAVSRRADRDSGIVTTGVPAGASVTEAKLTPDSAFYTYDRIHIRAAGEAKDWYYIARTPIEAVLTPNRRIRSTLGGLNKGLSAAIDRELLRLSMQILALSGIVVFVALVVAFTWAKTLTRPLEDMAEAVGRVGRGDLDARVEIATSDEIGEVGAAINAMIRGLKEGLFVKSTFKRYLAPAVVERLLRDPSGQRLGGERRELTVFFSDLSGFTSVSEQLGPERLVELINEYLSVMTDAAFAHEGTVDKYEGDAVVAFWGAPIAQPDHALRACKAALDALSAFQVLAKIWRGSGLPAFGLRIGINTGPMVVGNIGSAARLEYTVMGDAVNLGSRLEGANKVYGTAILISEATRAAAGSAVETRELDLIAVKGKKRATRIYELLGAAGTLTEARRRGRDEFERGLAGYRARKWDEAEAAFRAALSAFGEDEASRVFLARIAAFRREPPPADWDGVFILSAK